MNVQKNSEKGFTIIEVVLVLAIAGLIFLMVFIALPALQRSQRDTARKTDVGSVASAVTSYTNNNRGGFPTTANLETQLGVTGTGTGKTYKDVSANTNNVIVYAAAAAGTITVGNDAEIRVYKGLKCSAVNANGSVTLASGASRQFATVTRLEGGNNTGYCLDS